MRAKLEQRTVWTRIPTPLYEDVARVSKKHAVSMARLLSLLVSRYLRDLDEVLSEMRKPVLGDSPDGDARD